MKKLFGKSELAVYFLKSIQALSSVLLTFYISWAYSLEEVGKFSGIQASAIVLATLALAGTNESIIYFVAKSKAKIARSYLKLSCAYFLLLLLGAGLLGHIALSYFDFTSFDMLLEIIYLALPLGVIMIISGYCRGLDKAANAAFYEIGIIAFLTLLALLPLNYMFSEVDILLVYTSITWIMLFVSIIQVAFATVGAESSGSNEGIKASEYLLGSLHFSVFSIVGMSTSYFTIMICSAFLDYEAVGLIKIAQQLCILVSFVLVLGNFVLPVKYLRLYESNRLFELESLARKSSLIMFCVGSFIAIILFYSLEYIFLVFSVNIKDDSFVWLMVGGQLVNVASGSVLTLLKMTGFVRVASILSIATAISYFLMLVIFGRFDGIDGVGYSMLVFFFFQNVTALYLVHRFIGINPVFFLRRVE
ncbi:hypothetical protein [Marinobacter sp.]|uniref:lipopolysaccharide biosynthesis protein n=5 Tax=Marinobacter sp. TaxID=50741 RepID=UPI0032968A43